MAEMKAEDGRPSFDLDLRTDFGRGWFAGYHAALVGRSRAASMEGVRVLDAAQRRCGWNSASHRCMYCPRTTRCDEQAPAREADGEAGRPHANAGLKSPQDGAPSVPSPGSTEAAIGAAVNLLRERGWTIRGANDFRDAIAAYERTREPSAEEIVSMVRGGNLRDQLRSARDQRLKEIER